MPFRVAFAGRKGSGKSLFASCLVNSQCHSFAQALKQMQTACQRIAGFELCKDREFLQQAGSWARKVDPLVFLRKMRHDLIDTLERDSTLNLVVDDVRFPNEAEYLHANGFRIIRLTRTDDADVDTHESEIPLDNQHIDVEFENNDTIDLMRQKITQWIMSQSWPVAYSELSQPQ